MTKLLNARTFRAASMRATLEQIKHELGPDAVILATRTLPGLRGAKSGVEITAAPGVMDQRSVSVPPRRSRPAVAASAPSPGCAQPVASKVARSLPPALYPHYVQLVQNEVAADVAADLMQRATADLVGQPVDGAALRGAVRSYIARLIPEAPPGPPAPRRIAFVGPSGAGKTTTVAKLAARLHLGEHRPVALLSLGGQRLAAHEQLRQYAEMIGVPCHTANAAAEVRADLPKLRDHDVLIDTLGVGLREQGRFARLASLLRAARPDETHLVLPASLTPEVQQRLAASFAPLGLSGVVLTRLDDAVGFGVILNVIARLNLPVRYLSAGQTVPDDLETACGSRLAAVLLPADG